MKISEAANISGLEPSAIRFYESTGVLPESRRTESGYRDYGAKEVDVLRFVHRLRALDLPLDDVKEIVGLRLRGEAPCRPVRAAIDREAAAIDARIADLRRLRGELTRLQRDTADVVDDWPTSCVCHVLGPEPSAQH